MRFTKMQGIGNDYVYVNCLEKPLENPSEVARRVSDRHFGIGSDGLILICPSETADFRMDIYNSDGSRAQMCGNGIRCIGKYVYDRGLTNRETVTVETLGGIKTLRLHVENGKVSAVTVDMGVPELAPEKIPARWQGDTMIAAPVDLHGRTVQITAVSMGNPHAVVFVPEVENFPVEKAGPLLEHHPLFPERINVEFVEAASDNSLRMRVWERGAGETMACGTGACASLTAAVLCGKCGREATIHLLGGDLSVRWDRETDHIFMTGPAAFVFDGETEL